MTVRLRSFIQTSGVAPPVPPPVVTMAWTVQPTDTQAGGTFNPPVAVQVSDHQAGNTIILTNTCGGPTGEAVTDPTGTAVFTGFGVGNVITSGCRLIAHNATRPTVADASSDLFNVIAPPVLIEVVNNGTAFGSAAAPQGFPTFAVIGTQSNGALFNIAGADLIVIAVGIFSSTGLGFSSFPHVLSDALGNTYSPMFGVDGVSNEGGSVWLQIFTTRPVNTAGSPVFSFTGNGTPVYPGICAVAFQGTASNVPVFAQARSSDPSPSVWSGIPSGIQNLLISGTAFGEIPPTISGPSIDGHVSVLGVGSLNIGSALGWATNTRAIENFTWTSIDAPIVTSATLVFVHS